MQYKYDRHGPAKTITLYTPVRLLQILVGLYLLDLGRADIEYGGVKYMGKLKNFYTAYPVL